MSNIPNAHEMETKTKRKKIEERKKRLLKMLKMKINEVVQQLITLRTQAYKIKIIKQFKCVQLMAFQLNELLIFGIRISTICYFKVNKNI